MPLPPPETQSQRWLKYGGNVVLSSVVVILLAAGITYISQRHPKRIDTTVAGIYSLKPQTKAVLDSIHQKVRLVSLYPNPPLTGKSGDALAAAEEERARAATVSDLLQEYAKASPNISIDFIDPEQESTKADRLVEDVTNKYGEELKPYKQLIADFPRFVDTFKAFADEQTRAIEPLGFDKVDDPDLAQILLIVRATITKLAPQLAEAQENLSTFTSKKIPDYVGAVGQIRRDLTTLEALLGAIVGQFKAMPEKTPQPIKDYAAKSVDSYEATRKLVSDQLDKAAQLKDLKLDALKRSIGRSTLLVMGESEMKVLGFGDVWQAPDDMRSLVSSGPSEKPKLRFAGEQQVSTALVSISRKNKPLVIFVRPGGMPLANSPFGRSQWSGIARRLKEADFEVVEKDLSGQYAQQAMMQGMPVTEATDEQMRDRSATWVVFAVTSAMSQAGPNPIPGKLQEHLTEGGSAVVLFEPEGDPLDSALANLGVRVRTDAVVVKDVPKNLASAGGNDIISQAQAIPYILRTARYGDHPLTKPVGSLESLFLALCPVELDPKKAADVKATGILPITRETTTWGETSFDQIGAQSGPKVAFDPAKDIPNTDDHPLFGGAAIEKGKSRVVLLGSARSFGNTVLSIADPELEKRGLLVPQFPGNSELFTDAVLWTSKNETMLAISPAAMEVSRVRPIPDAQLAFIRWGILFGALPGTVVLLGISVYLTRRD